MQFSLIMATYNRWELTQACLVSLWATLPANEWELIIVDNASQDETPTELGKLGDRIVFLRQDTNLNYAAANNLAAAKATGEYLIFINNDLVFFPGWWEPMLRVFANHPKAGAVGNVQWNPRSRRFDHMGVMFFQGQPLHFGRDAKFRPFRGVTEWGAVTAACWMMKRSVFEMTGGFDTAFVNGFEDVDLCLRLGEQGYRHYVENSSVIHHYVSSSPGRHDAEDRNYREFIGRWKEKLKQTWELRDEKLQGWSYLMCVADRPSWWGSEHIRHAIWRILFGNKVALQIWSLSKTN